MNPYQENLDRLVDELGMLSGAEGRISELNAQIKRMAGATALACPQCRQHDHLADVTFYPGVCNGTFARLADGEIDFDGDGDTDVIWESGVAPTDGNTVQCDACGWTGNQHQLVTYEERPDDDGFECEDCNVNGEGCQTHGAAFKAARQAIMADPDRVFAALVATGLVEGES